MLYQKLQNVFFIDRILKVLLTFVTDCYPSALRLSMSVSGQRWTSLEVKGLQVENVRLTVFKLLQFRFQNAPEQIMKLFLSRIQLISFSSCSRIIL